VRLADRRARIVLFAFPRGLSRSRFGARSLLRSRERRRRWGLRIRGGKRTLYRLRASFDTLRRPFRPRCVTLGGRRLRRKAWRYDRRHRVLYARFRTKRRSSLLVARAKRCRVKPRRRRGRPRAEGTTS
jgi:hypothetical protein